MNVLLRDTEEYIDGKHTGSLGLVLIRYVKLDISAPSGIGYLRNRVDANLFSQV